MAAQIKVRQVKRSVSSRPRSGKRPSRRRVGRRR